MEPRAVTVSPDHFTTLLMDGNAEAIYAQLSQKLQQEIPLSDLKNVLDQGMGVD